jgi:23S rRNA (adenine2030-N6)-methyltransferase
VLWQGGRRNPGETCLNYRHAFHAGNFADLVKHASLLAMLDRLTGAQDGPLTVIDTHGGAGLYDITGDEARKSGEAAAGVARLMTDAGAPRVFAPLKAAVEKANPDKALRFYPGSPRLIADALRPADSLVACETRPDDLARLRLNLTGANRQVLGDDGYATALKRTTAGPTLIHIDPPFERADEYDRIAATVAGVVRRNPQAGIMIWLPLKDLETFDAFLRTLETMQLPRALIVETRLRPLHDPMRMNGCALVILNGPPGLEADAAVASDWIARTLGDAGGQGRVWRL